MNRGIAYTLFAYIFWGLHPIYWKLLQHVPSIKIVSHRVLWSFLFFAVIISSRKGWKELIRKIKTSDNKLIIFIPAFLIGSNWLLYIWAVNAGFVIETSQGYFISPLISVFLGVIFLKEKLKIFQWTAVAIAVTGVLVMTFVYGQFPWIALYLAGTWGTYGLLRKKSPLGPVEGLTLETSLMLLPVLIYITSLTPAGEGIFAGDISTALLLVGTGIISGTPLLVFIAGARLINLSLVGILQYIYPTLIFLLGAFVYNEELNEAKISGFIFIWTALIIYTVGGTFSLRRKSVAAASD